MNSSGYLPPPTGHRAASLCKPRGLVVERRHYAICRVRDRSRGVGCLIIFNCSRRVTGNVPQREFNSVPHFNFVIDFPNIILHNELSGADLSSDLLVFQALDTRSIFLSSLFLSMRYLRDCFALVSPGEGNFAWRASAFDKRTQLGGTTFRRKVFRSSINRDDGGMKKT